MSLSPKIKTEIQIANSYLETNKYVWYSHWYHWTYVQHVYPSDLIRGLAELNSTIDCRASRKQQSAWFKQCKCKQCLTQQDSQESRPQVQTLFGSTSLRDRSVARSVDRSFAESLGHVLTRSSGRSVTRPPDGCPFDRIRISPRWYTWINWHIRYTRTARPHRRPFLDCSLEHSLVCHT